MTDRAEKNKDANSSKFIKKFQSNDKFNREQTEKIKNEYKKYSSGKVLNSKEIDVVLNDYEDGIGNMEEHEKNIATTYMEARKYLDDFIDRRDRGEKVDYDDPVGKQSLAVCLFFEEAAKYGYDEKMPTLMTKVENLYKNHEKLQNQAKSKQNTKGIGIGL